MWSLLEKILSVFHSFNQSPNPTDVSSVIILIILFYVFIAIASVQALTTGLLNNNELSNRSPWFKSLPVPFHHPPTLPPNTIALAWIAESSLSWSQSVVPAWTYTSTLKVLGSSENFSCNSLKAPNSYTLRE